VGIDPDPRIRWDSVDCLTFVETAMALAVSPAAERLLPILDDIRYESLPPDFQRRNHFVESQWIPHNLAKGYLQPISREIAGEETVVATTTFTAKKWRTRSDPSELPLPESAVPLGDFSLDVVPIAYAEKHLAEIPDGSLLFVVRQDSARVPTRVSHVGFVLEDHGRKILRHAAKAPYERVVNEPLSSFFERNSHYDSRPVIGFSLYQVRVPAERIAALPKASLK
jgi:D-alanyl-D-alanine carboxypeptidase/D-alanyl-D-alanine-endopeptidase (penicillin-binding protein 4)